MRVANRNSHFQHFTWLLLLLLCVFIFLFMCFFSSVLWYEYVDEFLSLPRCFLLRFLRAHFVQPTHDAAATQSMDALVLAQNTILCVEMFVCLLAEFFFLLLLMLFFFFISLKKTLAGHFQCKIKIHSVHLNSCN